MLIQPVGPVQAASFVRKPVTAAPVAPLDSVQLVGAPPQAAASFNLAAQALSAASQGTPAPGVARPGLEELRQAAERLQAKGMTLQHRPKLLFLTLGFKDSNPDKVAALAEQKPERVRVMHPQHEKPMTVRKADDMIVMDALYGKSDVSQLNDPVFATALLALEKKYPDKVDSYSGYLSGDRIRLEPLGIYSVENTKALAYLEGLTQDTAGLEYPRQATTLRQLREAGLTPEGSLVRAYCECGAREYSRTSFLKNGLVVAEVSNEELADSQKVVEHVRKMGEIADRLTRSLGEKVGAEAVGSLRRSSGQLDLDTRAALAEKVFPGKNAGYVFDAVAVNADNPGQVDAWLAVARRFEPGARYSLSERLGALKKVTPKNEVPGESLLKRFETFLPYGPENAALMAGALEKHPHQPENPEAFLPRLTELCGDKKEVGVRAFAALASQGRLAEDIPLLESLIESAPNADSAIAAYPTLVSQVSPEHREFYLDLWKHAPECNMEEVWKAVFRPGTASERAPIWKRGIDLMEGFKRPDRNGYTRLMGSLPDGPELAWRAEMLERVLIGAQGDVNVAEQVWSDFQNSNDLETAARLYEATGQQDQAARAAEILTREDLAGPFRYEQRRDALATLIAALGGKVDEGVSAWRHLLSVSGPDLVASAKDFGALLTACGDEEKARIAYGAVRTSPPVAGSRTSADSLALALRARGGDLGAARALWGSLEEVDSGYPRADKVKNLELASRSQEHREEMYAWMTEQKLDDEGRSAVELILGRRGEWQDKVALLKLMAPASPHRKPLMEALQTLDREPLPDYFDLLVPHAEEKDFAELTSAIRDLSWTVDRAKVERLLAARASGDSWKTLGKLMSKTGERFEDVRQSLGGGSVEGKLVENTRWLVSQDCKVENWEAVRRPVGSESTAERQKEFVRLGGSAAAWKALTSWMQPGESLGEAVDAAAGMRQKLSRVLDEEKHWVSLLAGIREKQMSGSLEHLSLAQLSERFEDALLDAGGEALLTSARKPSVQSVLNALCDRVAGGSRVVTGEHHVVIGGVRVATR